MKIRQIKESVDWEKSMDGNDNNLDRIKKLKNLQVDVPPVMGDALEDDEKFDKNSKEVFTKLAKDAKSVTPENPKTGKQITRKPYTEKLTLDEKLFKEAWTSFGGSWRNQTVRKVNYTEEDISDIAEELMNWYGEYFEGWEAADIKDALYGLDGERIPGSDCPIVFTMEEDEDDELDWDDEEYEESFSSKNQRCFIIRDKESGDYDRICGTSYKDALEKNGLKKYEVDLIGEDDGRDWDDDDFDECMNEDYYHFEYKSGANPYIAKTEKERDRILRKYKNKVTKKDDKSFVIDDTEKDSFAIEEDYDRPIATMGLTNTSGIGIYDLNDEEVTFAFIDGGEKEPVKQTAAIEYDCEDEEDCRPYFSVGDTKYFLDDFMRITESKSSNLKKKSLDEAKDPDEIEEEETVLDFVDSRLFGTNKNGSKPSSPNYRKVYNFLDDIQIPIKGGKGHTGSFFYPDSNSTYFVDSEGSGTKGKLGRRYPMFDDGIGVYLVDKDEEVLAKAVANELNLNYKLTPISSNKGFNYVAKIFIPESIMEMPIEEYLDSIGKSLKSYKKGTGKRGRKARNQE